MNTGQPLAVQRQKLVCTIECVGKKLSIVSKYI